MNRMAYTYVPSRRHEDGRQDVAADETPTSSAVLEALARRDLEDQAQANGEAAAGPGDPIKHVSPRAFEYLGFAQDAIDHTKQVITDQGNQLKALERTKGNSYNRLKVVRDESVWSFSSEYARTLARANPHAYAAAKAEFVRGGNCGEHAVVAFNYLNSISRGIKLQNCSYAGLDHAFVILGDLSKPEQFPDHELVVADPWPMKPEACLWEDHFANRGKLNERNDRSKIEIKNAATSNATNLMAQIKAGLVLSDEGARRAAKPMSVLDELHYYFFPDDFHFWDQDDATKFAFDYHLYDPDAIAQVSVEVPRGLGWEHVAITLASEGIYMSVDELIELNGPVMLHPGKNVIKARRPAPTD